MDRIAAARDIMTDFARSTGLSPIAEPSRRYLWTDAFAVCNFLGLYEETGDTQFRSLAVQLVDQVHSMLGRYRPDDTRSGRLSGLKEKEAKLHPTAGGLRIGKQLRERRPTEPLDERLEWDRDGQYFHYLTKWMHALSRTSKVTGDGTYNAWAIELASAAHGRFVYSPGPGRPMRMYWKMSTDLSYPLVQSMGLHDPLDGMITFAELAAGQAGDLQRSTDLYAEIADMTAMCKGRNWITDDPLGIGGLLSDASRAARLTVSGLLPDSGLLASVLEASLGGLKALRMDEQMKNDADYRLPFREFGLSIGLRAVPQLLELIAVNPATFGQERELKRLLGRLNAYEHLAEAIEGFWLAPDNRGETWEAHTDINMVMLATSLSPGGYLTL
jgi:hypothetical protein